MDESDLNQNGHGFDGVIRFESLDDGARVTAVTLPTGDGQVVLTLAHELDGDLELFMDPKTAEDLALALARASDQARTNVEDQEEDE